MKICLECSNGGHMDLMRSLSEVYSRYDHFFITFEIVKQTQEIPVSEKIYYIPNLRQKIDPGTLPFFVKECFIIGYLMRNSPCCFSILYREKPDLIISTGGPVTIPLFIIAKMLRIKTMYIESVTRIHELSGTGKIVYHITSVFLVQWETLVKKYKKAYYWGNEYDFCDGGN